MNLTLCVVIIVEFEFINAKLSSQSANRNALQVIDAHWHTRGAQSECLNVQQSQPGCS